MDLLDFFRGRYGFRKLLSLVGLLPWDSAYKLAILDDEDTAAAALNAADEAEGESSVQVIPMSRWDPMAELRASLMDGLMMVARTIVMVNTPKGKRVPEFRSQPRPETAVERLQRRRRDEVMSALEAQLSGLGNRTD